MSDRNGVADRLYALLVQLFGVAPPVQLVGWDGSKAGGGDGPTVQVHSRKAVRRLLWAPGELGLARAYVAGEIDIEGDLVHALRQLAEYGALIGPAPSLSAADRREILRTAVLLGAVGPAPKPPPQELTLSGEASTSGREQAAETAHGASGGTGPRLLEQVLGSSLTYSCAWWDESTTGLDAAQEAKLERICRVLRLQPGERLLDVGCGWGSLLLHAARHHDVSAVGVVRSASRADFVRRRVQAAGLADRIAVRLGDYAAIEDGPYDAIAAIEANEHLGEDDLVGYAAAAQQLLAPGGRLLQQQVTRRGQPQEGSPTFITSYVYADRPVVPVAALVAALEDAGLELREVTNLREHYPPTLRAWLANLERHLPDAERVAGEAQTRVWRLLLALAAVGFERARVSVHQVLAVRPFADGRSGWPDPTPN
ncbi:MAG: class I SAM-dependent methyltransferase [Nocardioidaceae bacterium]